jgi:hypothetical protein
MANVNRRAMVSIALIAALGCRGKEEPVEQTEPEGPVTEPSHAADDPVETPTDVEETPEPELPATEPERSASDVAAPAPAPPPTGSARDLAEELRDAVGSPADCMKDYQPAFAKTIRVQINAVVRPTGMIIEPQANAGGLSANDRRCIEERVGGVTLRPLDGQSSEPVSTYVEIQYVPAKVEVYDVAPPPPPPKNVVQPLPKKKPIDPSGVPIKGPDADPIEGPDAVPIEGPKGVPIQGPKPVPIESE